MIGPARSREESLAAISLNVMSDPSTDDRGVERVKDRGVTAAGAGSAPLTGPVRPSPKPVKASRVWSNLNLNGPVPARVRPAIGEWGPQLLPSTKRKKRARWLAPVIFALALAAVVLTGWFFWTVFR